MSYILDILSEYTRMRESGLETKAILQALRGHIETLNKQQREELAALIRGWEERASQPPPAPEPPPRKHNVIKPIGSGRAERGAPPPAPEPPPPIIPEAPAQEGAVTWIACPNCGKANQQHEVFCYACGQLLEPVKGSLDTKLLGDAQPTPGNSYFGPDSVLALRVRGSSEIFEVRPQKTDHEVIIGRASAGSAMTPDVNLENKQAADLGVSRMHLAMRYDPNDQTVLVSDLGSANGSTLNGQRILPKEIRVLRHGDELRLGKLVLMVSFRHPGSATD